MPAFFIYLLKVNIALLLFYMVYRFILRALTFYRANRVYLLSVILISSLFPFVKIQWSQQPDVQVSDMVYYTPNWEQVNVSVQQAGSHISVWGVLYLLYWLGVVVMAFLFLRSCLALAGLYLHSQPRPHTQVNLRVTWKNILPFSFWNTVFVNPERHDAAELETILQHEAIHAREKHSTDLLLAEVNKIFYWFNPGAWLMKAAIRENLEFIADEKVLRNGGDKRTYQYQLLRSATGLAVAGALTNRFALSHLKKRIIMMNQKRSGNMQRLRYLLLLPLLAAGVVLFAQKKKNEPVNEAANKYSIDKIAIGDTTGNGFHGKIRAVAATNDAAVQMVDGIPVAMGKDLFSLAWFSSDEVKAANGVVVNVDGEWMSFEKAATSVRRDDVVKGVGAGPWNGKLALFLGVKKDVGAIIRESNKDLAKEYTAAKPATTAQPDTLLWFSEKGITKIIPHTLFVLDGTTMTGEQFKTLNVSPATIASIDVLKGEKATIRYGEAAKNGVVVIKSKEPATVLTDEVVVMGYKKSDVAEVSLADAQTGEVVMTNKPPMSTAGSQPLYVVDGRKKTVDEFKEMSLSPTDIKSIDVLKSTNAIAIYGDAGKNGVVAMTTKNASLAEVVVTGYGTALAVKADTVSKDLSRPEVYLKVTEPPKFNGSFRSFLEQNLRYPVKAQDAGYQGIVKIQFIVDSKGRVLNVGVAADSKVKNKYLVAEAIRILKATSGKWLPASIDGVAVKSYHEQAINFILQED
jgi:bla regulator protein blaR1